MIIVYLIFDFSQLQILTRSLQWLYFTSLLGYEREVDTEHWCHPSSVGSFRRQHVFFFHCPNFLTKDCEQPVAAVANIQYFRNWDLLHFVWIHRFWRFSDFLITTYWVCFNGVTSSSDMEWSDPNEMASTGTLAGKF